MFWLTRYIGSGLGTDPDSFRPLGADELGLWDAIDLRPDSSVAAGFALLHGVGPLPVAAGRVSLGDDPDAASPAVKSAIESRLGITLADNRLRRIVRSLLVEHARTDGTRWKPLQREGNRYRVWFGGLFDDFPSIAGGAVITESFNKADSVTLGPDLTWTEVTGNIDVVSNQAKLNAGGGFSSARAQVDLATANHYARGNNVVVPTDNVHIYVRFDTFANTAYLGLLASTGGGLIYKMVGGSFTALSSTVTGLATSSVSVTCSVNGSTVRHLHNGVEQLVVTDTSIFGNLRTGIGGFGIGSTIDSFEAGDLARALPFAPPRIRRVLMRSAR